MKEYIARRVSAVHVIDATGNEVPSDLLDSLGISLITNEPVSAPTLGPAIADRTYVVGSAPVTIDLSQRFLGAISYGMTPTNIPGVTRSGAIVTIDPATTRPTTAITVSGTNTAGTATMTFNLTVNAVSSTFVAGDWTLATGLEANQLVVNVNTLPANGGSPITAIQYSANSGTWTPLGGAGTGPRTLTMPAAGTSYSVRLRAVNAAGNSTPSDTKTATSGAAATAPAMSFSGPATNRVHQRQSTTGGDLGLGSGSISISVTSNQATPVYARLRNDADGAIIKAAWQAGEVSAGAGAVVIGNIPAFLGWMRIDIAPTATGPWVEGTQRFGMGRVVAVSGQSLAVRLFGRIGDTATMASLGVAIDPRAAVQATYTDSGRTGAGQTLSWQLPADGTDYDSAFLGEFLRLEIARSGVSCAAVGHSRGGQSISAFLPGGSESAALRAALNGAGGFEAFIWFQGHSNSQGGTAKATYKTALDTLFADITARNAVRGANYQKLLCPIPNITSTSWGTRAQIDEIRQAHYEWAQENGGIYSIPMDIQLYDGVHQDMTGSRRLGERWTAAFGGTAIAAPAQADSSPTFTASVAGFGQQLDEGYTSRALTSLEALAGACWTMEGWITISAGYTGVRVAMGADQKGWIGVAADGRLIANYQSATASSAGAVYFNGTGTSGGGTNPIINDGVRRHVRLVATPGGGYLFVDGNLVGSSATAPRSAAGTGDFRIGSFGSNPATFVWPGTVDEAALFAAPLSVTTFTPPAEPYTGTENGLFALHHFDGSTAGLMAA